MTLNRAWLLLAACLMTPITTASANVVTDWDEKAVAFIQPRMVPPVAYRAMAIMHIAMFDAVNSIEPVYRPYYAQLPATRETSKEAAAAAAAGLVLTKLVPEAASDIQAALKSYLAAIPDGAAKSDGIKLGACSAPIESGGFSWGRGWERLSALIRFWEAGRCQRPILGRCGSE